MAPRPGDATALGAGAAAGLAVSMLVASQCYGTGAAVALVAPIVAFLLGPATLCVAFPRTILAAVPVLVLIAWVAMTGQRTRLNPSGFDSTKAFALLAHVAPLEERGVARARERLERAIRAQPVGATVCLPVQPAFLAVDFRGTLGVFVLYYPRDEFEGRLVRFVSSNPKALALRATSAGLRRLILPDGACPQPGGAHGRN